MRNKPDRGLFLRSIYGFEFSKGAEGGSFFFLGSGGFHPVERQLSLARKSGSWVLGLDRKIRMET